MTDENTAEGQEVWSSEKAPVDTTVPNASRVWDYWLGGKDNFEADRDAARQLEATAPMIVHIASASRAFLRRAILYLAEEIGIRQFIDINSGLPTVRSTHEIAQAIAPESRVVYVDNDPMVLAHARALLRSTPEGAVDFIDAELLDPNQIMAAAQNTLNLNKPVAIVMVNIRSSLSGAADLRSILATFLTAVAPGSYFVIAQLAGDIDPSLPAARQRWNQVTGASVGLRSYEEIAELVHGLALVEPGVVTVPEWRPDDNDPAFAGAVPMYGVVAMKPQAVGHRWFVSGPEEIDLSPLLSRLEERGVTPYLLSDVASLGTSISQNLQHAIVAADRVIIVLATAEQSLNSVFEAGVAAALGKPIVIIASPDVTLPSDLAGFFTVRARPDQLDAINFALDQTEGRVLPSNASNTATGRALGERVDQLLDRTNNILSLNGPASIERAAIDLLTEAIEDSGAVAVQANLSESGFDLGVWSDDLDSIAANPLLVEVKRTLDPLSVRQATAAVQANPAAHAALIVVLAPMAADPVELGAARFPVLTITLTDLIGKMRTASFAEVIRQLRNQSVHGVRA